jgi:hypothetical protein
VRLEEVLAGCDPAAAVMVNIEIAQANQIYMEEGATLSRTLMPHLDMITDYRFLQEEA